MQALGVGGAGLSGDGTGGGDKDVPAGPAGGGGGGGRKAQSNIGWSLGLSKEDKLKRAVSNIEALKVALEVYAAAVRCKPSDGGEDVEETEGGGGDRGGGAGGGTGVGAAAALAALCEQALDALEQLHELVTDDDVVALATDQQCVELVCTLVMKLRPCAVPESAEHGAMGAALLLLKMLASNERCMLALLAHDKGRSLVKMIAWMQGIDGLDDNADGSRTVADVTALMEILLQHDSIRRTLIKKTWSVSLFP